MNKLRLLIVIICVFAGGCNKGQPLPYEYEIIYPLSYYPVYPGSYWVYTAWAPNGDTGVFTIETEPKYNFFDNNRMPFFKGASSGIRQYSYYANNDWIRRLDTLPVGTSWLNETQAIKNGPFNKREITAKDTSIVINSIIYYPVIEITDYMIGMKYTKLYYAKNVGLIKSDNIELGYPDSVISGYNLAEYYINN